MNLFSKVVNLRSFRLCISKILSSTRNKKLTFKTFEKGSLDMQI